MKPPIMSNSTASIDVMESCANQVVKVIEECVSAMRAIPDFERRQTQPAAPLDQLKLFACLKELGVDASVCDLLATMEDHFGTVMSTTPMGDAQDSTGDGDRNRLVHEILYPLLTCLAQFYEVIDALPQPQRNAEQEGRKNKPPPPRGMLSIQNYTDVAVLIEFLVCTSILPNLESNILTPVEERARYLLPKSLAGRIPRTCLLWGSANIEQAKDANATVLELQSTVIVIGKVVLLDRFRPMILPRHLADLFAAMLQSDELQEKTLLQSSSPTDYETIRASLLPGPRSSLDSFSLANTYQSLLLRGTKAPLWLRQRVSTLLTTLACQDLPAIVQVFVRTASSSQEDMTGASLRLARALGAGRHTALYFHRLAKQLLQLLDVEGSVESAVGNPDVAARVLTVWAVLDQLTSKQLAKYILPILSEAFFPTDADEYSVHRVIRRIILLFSMQPPSLDASAISGLFLSAIPNVSTSADGIKMTILGQLIRVASLTVAMESQAKVDAILALRLFVASMSETSFKLADDKVSGNNVFALALVYAVEPSWWDMNANQYCVSVASHPTSSLEHVAVKTKDQDAIGAMEERAKFTVANLLTPLSEHVDNELEANKEHESQIKSLLPSALFHILLIAYFSNSKNNSSYPHPTTTYLRSLQADDHNSATQMSVMLLLPLIGEQCSIDSLLMGGNENNGEGLLTTMSLILESASQIHDGRVEDTALSSKASSIYPRFKPSDELFCTFLGISDTALPATQGSPKHDDFLLSMESTLLSIVSVVLSLLAAMLELGAQQRQVGDENVLQMMLPSLEKLSTFAAHSALEEPETAKCRGEIAEMASHAMVLIVSRAANIDIPSFVENTSPKFLIEFIKEAEGDLKSEQPPIRARGVITLRHLARGYLEENKSKNSLIVEVGASHDIDCLDAVSQILQVCIMALDDRESYVYLAAIQTIVAAADVKPRELLPLMATGMATGSIRLSDKNETKLTSSQRVKIGEAVLFAIRRRGVAIYEFTEKLLDFLLYGNQLKVNENKGGSNHNRSMQEQSNRHFLGDLSDLNDELSREEFMDQKSVRVNAGGPVFALEEDDLVRGTCIAVLAELVLVAPTSTISGYCAALVRLARNVLHLEASRPVRRSAALLCSAIYSCVLREIQAALEMDESGQRSSAGSSFLIALVRSDETLLKATIESCIYGLDSNGSGTRVYDQATTARCQEALANRVEVEELGLFAAARLYISSEERQRLDPISQIVRSRLEEKNDSNNLDAMRGLGIDPNVLSFR
jgi:hypothetical protein